MTAPNHEIVSKAFGKQSARFDELYDSNPIVTYMRNMIRNEVLSKLKSGDHIFEVNAGTGTDALFFARKGYSVTALEISSQMVSKAIEKVAHFDLKDRVAIINGSFENTEQIEGEFDYLYSNFGGLNCTPDLEEVIRPLVKKLKPGGKATLTILPPFTLWEKLFVFRGNFKVANRRKFSGPSKAHIEGENFNCWYYNPDVIINSLEGQIKDVVVTGICVLVPPSFLESFPNKFPKLFQLLVRMDRLVSKLPLFNRIGDYYMISFTKI